MRMLTAMALATHSKDADQIPEVPPLSVRGDYLDLSRQYIRWCSAMLAWTLLCVGYFLLTWQPMELTIGLCLGVLLITLVLFPATLFGGSTWYKRLGWVTVLTGLFSAMFLYPIVIVAVGIWRRIEQGRYTRWIYFSDIWHLVLCALTLVVAAWTLRVALRASRLVRTLRRGEYQV